MGIISKFIKKISQPKTQPDALEESRMDETKDEIYSQELQINEVIMLAFAEKYKTNERQFPAYLINRYSISFPMEILERLRKADYIRPATAIESLPNLKLPDLKEIAKESGLKTSGNKDSLCTAIAESVSDVALDERIADRYWKRTERGEEELAKNSWIYFYIDNHPYDLTSIGIDMNRLRSLSLAHPNAPIRDLVWGEMNEMTLDTLKTDGSKGNFAPYCKILFAQTMFLYEEDRCSEAFDLLSRYFIYHINHASTSYPIYAYTLVLTSLEGAIELFYNASRLMPYEAKALQDICLEIGIGTNCLKNRLTEAFANERNNGIMSNNELADFIVFEMKNQTDESREICTRTMKKKLKNIKRKY